MDKLAMPHAAQQRFMTDGGSKGSTGGRYGESLWSGPKMGARVVQNVCPKWALGVLTRTNMGSGAGRRSLENSCASSAFACAT